MNIPLKNILVSGLGLYCYFAASVLNAAETVDDFFDKTLEELAATPVTIGSGSSRTLSQSPAVASVITADHIKSMGATELHEVLETVPGIHAGVQPDTGDYNYSVRGIQNTNNSELLVLLNGTRITSPIRGTLMATTELPLEAIQQIEVIRGPGSALYGADAFAGVINIITKKAKEIDGANVGVRAGDHNTQSGWGQYGGTWAGWDIASSLQYQRTDGDGGRIIKADTQTYIDQAVGTNASHAPGAMNTQYEIFNGHFNLTRKHWDLGFWASGDQSGMRAGLVGALDPKGITKAQQYMAEVKFSTQDWFKEWEFGAHASYLQDHVKVQAQTFPDNVLLPTATQAQIGSADLDPTRAVFYPDGINFHLNQSDQIPTFELISLYKGLDKHLVRATAGFRHEQTSIKQQANIGAGADSLQPVVDGTLTDISGTAQAYFPTHAHRSIWSMALQDEWRFADNWQLTAGGRYDDYSDFGGTFNPRAALVWDINKKLTTKWLYGKAFRAPSFTERYIQNNQVLQGNTKLEPETIDSYEWAIDYHPTPAVRTATNFYYYEITDLIAAVQNPNASAYSYQNDGNQNGYGLELEGNWQANAFWSFNGNYAWQHAIEQNCHVRVTGVPEHHVYAAAVYHFMPKWQVQSQLNWVGGRSNVTPQHAALEDYQTVDFTLRGKKLWGQVNVAASLRNAFDTTPYEPTALAIGGNLPMPGRSFYLEASIHF